MAGGDRDVNYHCLQDNQGAIRHLFASFGLPEQIVSDNGPQLVSEEFQQFVRTNGIKHIRCAPYHPASNGAAERFVRTFKTAMKAARHDGHPIQHSLENFLLTYRTTPHSTTGVTPVSLFLGRSLRTRLDLMRPELEKIVSDKQAVQKRQHDQHACRRVLHIGQHIMVKNLHPEPPWIPGVITQGS